MSGGKTRFDPARIGRLSDIAPGAPGGPPHPNGEHPEQSPTPILGAGQDIAQLDPLPEEPYTELGYANRFLHLYGEHLRHVPEWKRWLVWDGMLWRHDISGQSDRWMKVVARSVMSSAILLPDKEARSAAVRQARRGEAAAGVAGALRLASTDDRVSVAVEQLDADPHILNCRNGILDLRTGHLGPHDPAMLLTKVTGAAYRPEDAGASFEAFFERIQPDGGMRDYLARLLGHTLTGSVVEHVLPILCGAGANGKSTLLAVVLAALGDYAGPADPELLMARSFDAHPTSVADLFGLRLAMLHESDQGRRLAEGTVKRLTGGDRLKARRMREDFWSFDPSHSFVMVTNHRPLIAGTDEGIWRRIRLVPFPVVVPEAERDQHLPDRLALALNAVLAWLVAGHQAWRRSGLDEPDAVLAATSGYRDDSDLVRRFIDERCLVGPHFTAQSSDLFKAWGKWCADEGAEPGTQKAFTTGLENRGHDKGRTNVGIIWRGIGLAADD